MTDFARLLATLVDSNARFILVGGVAATVHGSARLTRDVDVVYDRSRDNIERLVDHTAFLHECEMAQAGGSTPLTSEGPKISSGMGCTLYTPHPNRRAATLHSSCSNHSDNQSQFAIDRTEDLFKPVATANRASAREGTNWRAGDADCQSQV